MTPIIRRTFLAALAVAPLSHAASVHAVDALPDAGFVGFAETVNDFEIKSGQLALAKSKNELVRAYATRAIAEYTTNAQYLTRNRSEANVTMAPDENVRKIADDAMARLNSLQGAEFDSATPTHSCACKPRPPPSTAPIPRTATTAPCAGTRNGRCRRCRRFWWMPRSWPAAARRLGRR